MAADPSNARLWADADVYVAFLADNASPTIPADADAPFSADWDLVGLLDGDAGFTETRNEDTGDLFAWGSILMRTARRNFKLTRSFTAFEANPTTTRLRWPGSDGSQIYVPSGNRIERVKVAFETRDGAVTYRLISTHEAEITVDGDINDTEQAIASIPFLATIFPDADGRLFTPQSNAPASS